jgi:triosephosphate isomerase
MRKKIVAANWKMNMTQAESASFVQTLLRELGAAKEVEVVIVPPFTALAKVSEALGGTETIKIGAQNMYWEKSGAFTGEISAAMLRDLFVRYVVLGHSERPRAPRRDGRDREPESARGARGVLAPDRLHRRNARSTRSRRR